MRLSVTVVLIGLMINAWAQAGTAAFMVLAFASIGCAVVVALTGLAAGASVVKHAHEVPLRIAAKKAVAAIAGRLVNDHIRESGGTGARAGRAAVDATERDHEARVRALLKAPEWTGGGDPR